MGEKTPDAIKVKCPGCDSRFRLSPKKGRMPSGSISCPKCGVAIPIEKGKSVTASTESEDQSEDSEKSSATPDFGVIPPKTKKKKTKSKTVEGGSATDSKSGKSEADEAIEKLEKMANDAPPGSTMHGLPGVGKENPFAPDLQEGTARVDPSVLEQAAANSATEVDDAHSATEVNDDGPKTAGEEESSDATDFSPKNQAKTSPRLVSEKMVERLAEESSTERSDSRELPEENQRRPGLRRSQATREQDILTPKKLRELSKPKAQDADTSSAPRDEVSTKPAQPAPETKSTAAGKEKKASTSSKKDAKSNLLARIKTKTVKKSRHEQKRKKSRGSTTDDDPSTKSSLSQLFKKVRDRRGTDSGTLREKLKQSGGSDGAEKDSSSEPDLDLAGEVEISEGVLADIVDRSAEDDDDTPPSPPEPEQKKDDGKHTSLFDDVDSQPQSQGSSPEIGAVSKKGTRTTNSMLARLQKKKKKDRGTNVDALEVGAAGEGRGSGYIRLPTSEIQDVLGQGNFRLKIEGVIYEPVDKDGLIQLVKGGVLLGAEQISEGNDDWMPVAKHPVFGELRRKMASEAHQVLSRLGLEKRIDKSASSEPPPDDEQSAEIGGFEFPVDPPTTRELDPNHSATLVSKSAGNLQPPDDSAGVEKPAKSTQQMHTLQRSSSAPASPEGKPAEEDSQTPDKADTAAQTELDKPVPDEPEESVPDEPVVGDSAEADEAVAEAPELPEQPEGVEDSAAIEDEPGAEEEVTESAAPEPAAPEPAVPEPAAPEPAVPEPPSEDSRSDELFDIPEGEAFDPDFAVESGDSSRTPKVILLGLAVVVIAGAGLLLTDQGRDIVEDTTGWAPGGAAEQLDDAAPETPDPAVIEAQELAQNEVAAALPSETFSDTSRADDWARERLEDQADENVSEVLGSQWDEGRRDNEFLHLYADVLGETGDYQGARRVAMTGMTKFPDDEQFSEVHRQAIIDDDRLRSDKPTYLDDPSNYRAQGLYDVANHRGIMLEAEGDSSEMLIFKPERDGWSDEWRAEVAAWRFCELVICHFEVFEVQPAVVTRDFVAGLDGETEELESLVDQAAWTTLEIDGENVEAVQGSLEFVSTASSSAFPIEYLTLWRGWLNASNDSAFVDQPMTDNLDRLASLAGGRFHDELMDGLVDVSTGEVARSVSSLLIFDYLTNNWERFYTRTEEYGQNNPVIDSTIVSRHNGDAFQPRASRRVRERFEWTTRFSHSTVASIRALERDLASEVLFPNANATERRRLDVMWSQRDAMLERVDQLIAQHGDEDVLLFP